MALLKPLLILRNLILGSEPKLESSISNGEVFPCDYEIFRKDRISDNPGGGVYIAIHHTILATHQPKLDSNSEAIWVKLEFVKQKPLYLTSVYRPPGSQEESLDELEKSLLSLQSSGSCPRVILTGDFNVSDIMWEQSSVSSNPQYGLSLNQNMLTVTEKSLV